MTANPLKIDWPTCEQCGAAHDPELPHDSRSMQYHTWFRKTYGRAPTYEDAASHCSDYLKEIMRNVLRAYGLKPEDDAEMIWYGK